MSTLWRIKTSISRRNSKLASSFSFTSSAPVPALRSRVEPRTSPEVSPADTRAMTRMRGQWSDRLLKNVRGTFFLLVLGGQFFLLPSLTSPCAPACGQSHSRDRRWRLSGRQRGRSSTQQTCLAGPGSSRQPSSSPAGRTPPFSQWTPLRLW